MIVAKENKFLITKGRAGEMILWEKVRTGKDHIIFQHFGTQLYARYDSMHTPAGITIPEWHAFMRAEASAIIRELVKDETKKHKSKRTSKLVPALAGV